MVTGTGTVSIVIAEELSINSFEEGTGGAARRAIGLKACPRAFEAPGADHQRRGMRNAGDGGHATDGPLL